MEQQVACSCLNVQLTIVPTTSSTSPIPAFFSNAGKEAKLVATTYVSASLPSSLFADRLESLFMLCQSQSSLLCTMPYEANPEWTLYTCCICNTDCFYSHTLSTLIVVNSPALLVSSPGLSLPCLSTRP